MTKKKFMHRFLCVIAVCFVSVLAFLGFPATVGVMSYAEEIDVPDIMDGTIDDYNIENYPTANYFDITPFRTAGSFNNKVSYDVSDGLINSIIIETNEGQSYVSFKVKVKHACPKMNIGTYYTLSLKNNGSFVDGIYLDGNWTSGSAAGKIWLNGNSFECTSDMLEAYIVVYGSSVVGEIGGISEIMINKGTVAYPYTPYYKTLYNAGYTDGETNGYNAGYSAGVVSSLTGIFDNITVNSYAIVNGVSDTVYESKPVVVDGEIDLSYLYTHYNNLYSSNAGFESVVLSLVFGRPYLATYIRVYGYAANPLIAFGDEGAPGGLGVANDFLAVYTDDTDIAVAFIYDDVREVYSLRFNASTVPEKDVVSLSGWVFTELKGLQGLRLKNISNQYYVGFVTGKEQGVQEGLVDGEKIGYDKGYKVGIEDGKGYGYNDGYNAGETAGYVRGLETAEDGSLVGLIGVMFDAPLNGSLQLLNFEILGVNMLGFFTGVLTLMFVLKVLKLFLAK